MSSDSLDPRRPCHRLRVNLKICLLQTDCCRIEKVSCLFRAKPAQHYHICKYIDLFSFVSFSICLAVAYFPPKILTHSSLVA